MNGSASPTDGFRLVHAGPRLVVVDKPAGLLSVPGRGADKADCAAARVAQLFPHATGPIVCHRLDQATSGLLVFALDPDAQAFISLQFQRRRVEKHYIALVRGVPDSPAGRVELPLRADWPNRPRQRVDRAHGRPALTRWRLLEPTTFAGHPAAVLELTPITGKTHQLRVHAATPAAVGGIGCPILGDEIYDPDFPAPRLMLHAARLVLTDPDTLRRARFESEPGFTGCEGGA
jgi:tRNA pseudouridine32 synthase/23S rRNA pseudouridine746 synthase